MSRGFCLIILLATGFGWANRASGQQADSLASVNEHWETGFDTELGLLSLKNSDGDRERFLSLVLLPYWTKGPWEAGARIKLRMNGAGVRREDYDGVADIISIARYVQYSQKPLTEEPGLGKYGRLGELEEVRLGYGQIIGEYRNTVSFDNPKVGIEGSVGSGYTLVEGVLSSITSPELFGVRGSWWPFQKRTDFRKDVLFGATLAGDLASEGRLVNRNSPGVPYTIDEPGNLIIGVVPGVSDGPLAMVAVDAGMPIRTPHADKLVAYTELAKILGFGSGLSVGLNGTRQRGELQMEAWFEQRLIGKQYLPNYFNSLYEIERVQNAEVRIDDDQRIQAYNSKRNLLLGQDQVLFGTFMAFEGSVRRKYRGRISLDRIWNKANAGWFHIDIGIFDRSLPYRLRFMFDRINVGGLEDIWSGPSENGIMRLELAYQFWEKLMLGFRIRQSFEPVESLGRIVGQSKQTRIEPNVVLVL